MVNHPNRSRSFTNLEPSVFHKGWYIGYGAGRIWRVKPADAGPKKWCAFPIYSNRGTLIYGMTLHDISNQLAAFKMD